MKRMSTILLLAALALSVSVVVAQETPRVDARQKAQKERIKEGMKSGELTKPEAQKIVRQQKAVQKMEEKAKSDGVVTPKERARLQKAQQRTSKEIARQKNDRQKRD